MKVGGGWERNRGVCITVSGSLFVKARREPGCWQKPALLLYEKVTLEGALGVGFPTRGDCCVSRNAFWQPYFFFFFFLERISGECRVRK